MRKKGYLGKKLISVLLSMMMAVGMYAGIAPNAVLPEAEAASLNLKNPYKDADGKTVYMPDWKGILPLEKIGEPISIPCLSAL